MLRPAILYAGMTLLPLCSAISIASAEAVDISGNVSAQWQGFPDEGQFSGQDYKSNLSFSAEPELYWQWDDGNSSFLFQPYYRHDQQDTERSHGDIREMLWLKSEDNWELKVGISKVFWGVTEFQHLVDVVNQTDTVDSFDGEEKLGQPMINYSLVNDWGIVDAFVLPGFRERTFSGEEGRFRSDPEISTHHAEYQANEKDRHIDLALRWSQSIDVIDMGIYWFKGTNREPVLQLHTNSINNKSELTPYYNQMTQFGIDLQATIDAWLWKLEIINRDTDLAQFSAVQGGLEFTHYGVMDSAIDAGLLLEYGWDERHKDNASVSQNDIYAGTRFTLNDAASSALLVGVSFDNDYQSKSFLIEGSRRLGDSWKLALDLRAFNANKKDDPLISLRKDNRIQFTLERYF